MDNFCILPFISMEVGALGQPRVCCLNEKEMNNNDKQLNFKNNSISDAFYGSDMNELRSQFLKNEKPESCNKCWSIEKSGGYSKRKISNEKYKADVTRIKADPTDISPTFIDLKLGNICNLKCRICGVFSSSKWIGDQISIEKVHGSARMIEHYKQMNRQGQWPREAETFWQDIKELSKDITSLEITGGEPFLIREHFDFLQHAVDNGYAKNIHVHYNTNGTVFPEDAIKNIFPHFKQVEIAFSIDGLGEEFEYQRKGAIWSEVEENINKFHELRKTSSWLTTQLCTTVSVLNVLNIVDILLWAEKQKFNFIWVNILHQPERFCLRNLSQASKQYATRELTAQSFQLTDKEAIKQLEDLIRFINTDGRDMTDDIINQIKIVDEVRDEDFTKVMPKLTRLLRAK